MAALSPSSVIPASLRICDALQRVLRMPIIIASTETYSSPIDLEKSTAFWRASLLSRLRNTSPPLTFGSVCISLSIAMLTVAGLTPSFWNMKLTIVSLSPMMAFRMWTGSICCWPFWRVSSMAFCTTSCDLIVKLLKFIIYVVW